MKILRAQHLGICFGVRDAIAHAETLASQAPFTILGELVHNPLVRERLRQRGVHETSLEQPQSPTRRVMITAHGASDRKRALWQNAGFDIVDGTCPLVKQAHQQLKLLVIAGYFPVVIGKPGHIEVRGLTEDFPDAHVVETVRDAANLPRRSRYGVIAQTTQPIDHVRAVVDEIRRSNSESEVRFVDTVCKPTKDRQTALHALIAQAELIVVVGGHQSNNTRKLVETCLAAGRRAIHVERADELQPSDFEGIDAVGLTAGTSTLPETIDAVEAQLQRIANRISSGAKRDT